MDTRQTIEAKQEWHDQCTYLGEQIVTVGNLLKSIGLYGGLAVQEHLEAIGAALMEAKTSVQSLQEHHAIATIEGCSESTALREVIEWSTVCKRLSNAFMNVKAGRPRTYGQLLAFGRTESMSLRNVGPEMIKELDAQFALRSLDVQWMNS